MRICINGIAGKMGRRIATLALQNKNIVITGGLEPAGNPDIGKDIGGLIGIDAIGVTVSSDAAAVLSQSDCVIDFSTKAATPDLLTILEQTGTRAVIGTTGLDPKTIERIRKLADRTAVVQSPNMSIGVNLLFKLAPQIAKILGPGYDIEIVETHHRHKIDAPSGTAMKIAEQIAAATGRDLKQDAVYGREGIVGERKPSEIGILAMRGGDIVGEHTVLYAGIGERIELTHRAHSRDTFARGAITAALFLKDKAKGFFTMTDVLGINL